MRISITKTKISFLFSKYRKFLILNEVNYNILKRELGMEEYEELVEFKNLTICICKNDKLGLILV